MISVGDKVRILPRPDDFNGSDGDFYLCAMVFPGEIHHVCGMTEHGTPMLDDGPGREPWRVPARCMEVIHECHICDAEASVPCSNCGEYMCGVCECDDGFCDLCDQFRKPKQPATQGELA